MFAADDKKYNVDVLNKSGVLELASQLKYDNLLLLHSIDGRVFARSNGAIALRKRNCDEAIANGPVLFHIVVFLLIAVF